MAFNKLQLFLLQNSSVTELINEKSNFVDLATVAKYFSVRALLLQR